MSSSEVTTDSAREFPLTAILKTLSVPASVGILSWLGPSETLPIPAKPFLSLSGGLILALGFWAKWSYSLHKKLGIEEKFKTQQEHVKRATELSRSICECTRAGEIMTVHSAPGKGTIQCCALCGRWRVFEKDVHLLPLDSFIPPLPAKAITALEFYRKEKG